jgi:hypothetical protein
MVRFSARLHCKQVSSSVAHESPYNIPFIEPMGNPNRTIRRKEITELARQTWFRIWSDQMPKDWRVYLVRKTVIQRVYGRSVCGPLETRQENSGGSPHQTLQLPNARARTRASSNAGRAGRSRTHLGLRVQSGGAALVGQRASNQYMTRAFSLSDMTSLPSDTFSRLNSRMPKICQVQGDGGAMFRPNLYWTENRRHSSGTPLRLCAPRSPNLSPEPATGSLNVLETHTSSGPATRATRAPIAPRCRPHRHQ